MSIEIVTISEYIQAVSSWILESGKNDQWAFSAAGRRVEEAGRIFLRGVVLATKTETVTERVMSDIYEDITYRRALVFDRQEGLKWVQDGSATAYSTVYSPVYSHGILAPSEASQRDIEGIKKWLEEEAGVAEGEKAANEAEQRVLAEIRKLHPGKKVVVNRGRKVPVGTAGTLIGVFSGQWGDRVGIATSDRRDKSGRYEDVVWVAAANVDVVFDESEAAARIESERARAAASQRAKVVRKWRESLPDYVIAAIVAAETGATEVSV